MLPTRELALQTAQICKELGKHMNVQVDVFFFWGGGGFLKTKIADLFNPFLISSR